MREYIPTLDEVRDKYADARVGIGEWTRFDESVKQAVESAYAEFDRMIAEVEREAAEKALTEFAAELGSREMPESGIHINMTKYREGLIDGVNRAVRAASRRAEAYRQESGEGL